MEDTDALKKVLGFKDLIEMLQKSGAKVTFSKNCASGLLGGNRCNCWRCRKTRGEPVTEETEALAANESAEAQQKQREEIREFLKRQREPKRTGHAGRKAAGGVMARRKNC